MVLTRQGRGLFVTLEGVDGSGKTTQAHRLVKALETAGTEVLYVREPGGTYIAECIRGVLLCPGNVVSAETETLLFLAARAQNTAETILPNLVQGAVVVCDRYSDSTLAYQGHARRLGVPVIRTLNAFATGGLVPDITFLLDMDVEVSVRRQAQRNRMEEESLEFHKMVRQGYLAEAAQDPLRIRILDGARTEEDLHQEILESVLKLLGQNYGKQGLH